MTEEVVHYSCGWFSLSVTSQGGGEEKNGGREKSPKIHLFLTFSPASPDNTGKVCVCVLV